MQAKVGLDAKCNYTSKNGLSNFCKCLVPRRTVAKIYHVIIFSAVVSWSQLRRHFTATQTQ